MLPRFVSNLAQKYTMKRINHAHKFTKRPPFNSLQPPGD